MRVSARNKNLSPEEQIRKFQRSDKANKRCADCDEVGPTYICLDFGTFICTPCSGVHREYNHKVKGIGMSQWCQDEVSVLVERGNQKDKDLYLAKFSGSLPKCGDTPAIRSFIKNKYDDKRWMAEDDSAQPSSDSRDEEGRESRRERSRDKKEKKKKDRSASRKRNKSPAQQNSSNLLDMDSSPTPLSSSNAGGEWNAFGSTPPPSQQAGGFADFANFGQQQVPSPPPGGDFSGVFAAMGGQSQQAMFNNAMAAGQIAAGYQPPQQQQPYSFDAMPGFGATGAMPQQQQHQQQPVQQQTNAADPFAGLIGQSQQMPSFASGPQVPDPATVPTTQPILDDMKSINQHLQQLQDRMAQSANCTPNQRQLLEQMMKMMNSLQSMQANLQGMTPGTRDANNPNSGTGKNPFVNMPPQTTNSNGNAPHSGSNLQNMNNFMMHGLNSMNNMQGASTTQNPMAQQMHMQQQGLNQNPFGAPAQQQPPQTGNPFDMFG